MKLTKVLLKMEKRCTSQAKNDKKAKPNSMAKKHGWKSRAENLGRKAWVKCDCLCQPYPADTATILQIEYLKSRRYSRRTPLKAWPKSLAKNIN